ncbi:unnamed protein product [Staurois parvus]|uniref:Uncharacterized protein n=1 Tax=Staurois parvus TaxID=386267 RepID=A0ABN9GHL8_9NEOB|nr:unnamed protein product [Staurois parvus]
MRRFFIGKKIVRFAHYCRENRPIGKIGRFFSNFTEKKKRPKYRKTADQITH